MFLTGEFSRIARVSKRLLQYYDEIDLLKPAHTDPQTGYRYYSAKQLPRLNRILALKELGLSLEQIARMLDDAVSDDEIHGMLLLQKAELERKLVDDLQRFRRIEARLQRQSHQADVVLKSVPQQRYLSLRSMMTSLEECLVLIGSLVSELPERVGKSNLSHFLAIIHGDSYFTTNFEAEFGYLLASEIDQPICVAEHQLTVRDLAAIETMATTVHVGSPTTSHIGYAALGEWIEANGYRLAGHQREVFIQLTPNTREEDLVIELQFPIEKVVSPSNLLPDFLDKS
jgi:DNA-binding transcriptional MerR regulator